MKKTLFFEGGMGFFSRIFWEIYKVSKPRRQCNSGKMYCFSWNVVVEEVYYSSFSSLERSGLTNEAKKDLGGSSLKDTRRRFIMGSCCSCCSSCWEAKDAAQGLVSGLTSRSNWTCCSSLRSTGEVHLALDSSTENSGSVVSMESKLRLQESDNKRQSLEDFPNEFNLVLCWTTDPSEGVEGESVGVLDICSCLFGLLNDSKLKANDLSM
jgi:hypothetical protein